MKLSTLTFDLASSGIGSSNSVRAAGLHASDIYNDLYKDLEPGRYNRREGPPPPLLLETGLIFETALEEGLARRFASGASHEQIVRPGEFSYAYDFEGRKGTIHFNPDLFIYNTVFRIGEIKATWLSSKIEHDWLASPEAIESHREDIENAFLNPKLEKYYTQLKFYMKMLNTVYGRLYVCFIAGNYDRPFQTQLVGMDVEFTQDEIDQEYAGLMFHAVSKGMLDKEDQ